MNIKFDLGKKDGKVNDIEADELDEFDDLDADDDSSTDYVATKKNFIDEDNDKDDDDDDTDDDEDKKSSPKKSSGNSDFKLFLMKLAFIIVGIIVLLFVVLSIASGGNRYSYEKIEKIMTNAAKSYFADYPENLPKTESQIVEVETPTLVQAGKMKDLNEYTKKGVVCTGKVSVAKNGNDYTYTPDLNCGESYRSKTLANAIIDDSPVTTSGYGLYKLDDYYVFRGENVNNYVQLGDTIWRAVKLDTNRNVYLVTEKYSGYSSSWDDRYNTQTGYKTGINNYSTSRLKDFLDEIYNETKKDERTFTDSDRAKLSRFDVCTGKKDANSKINNNSIECQTTEKSQILGVLTLSDFINASVDPNCTSGASISCQNYNYLVTDYKWWTSTPVANITSHAYSITGDGTIKKSICSSYNYVRPVIKLSSRTMITGGNGTEKEPYIIK